jgi:predicted nucleic acid-binding protein
VKTSLDTNIVSGLLATTPQTATIAAHLGLCSQQGFLVISAPVYAESLAHPNLQSGFLKNFLAQTGIRTDFTLSESTWHEAGLRFAQYAIRRRNSSGRSPRRLMADFLIGAHTLERCDRLMTYDTSFYEQNFPEISLYPLPAA